MRLEYLPLDELVRWPRNPKDHAHDAIAESFGRFGFVEPMVLDERSGKLVAGHGRLDTLQSLKSRGDHPPAGIRALNGRWYAPVIRGIAFKDDAEAESYLLASNRLVELGGWDEKGLSAMLADLAAQQRLDGTGFDKDDVDDLLRRLSGTEPRKRKRVAFNARECTKACPVHCEKGKK
jgi:ParB-like chromosome segregation protein Spo0J